MLTLFIVIGILWCLFVGGFIGARLAILSMYISVFLGGFSLGVLVKRILFLQENIRGFLGFFEPQNISAFFSEFFRSFRLDDLDDFLSAIPNFLSGLLSSLHLNGTDILVGIIFGILAIAFHKFSIVIITSLLGALLVSMAFGTNLVLVLILFALGVLYQYKVLKVPSK